LPLPERLLAYLGHHHRGSFHVAEWEFHPVAQAIEVRTCAKREVSSIDAPPKPKVDVQEAIANAKVYCKEHPESFVSLRDYSGGIYNETCAAFAAEQHVTDPTYKIGSD
jgi:hypothetical protein